jgi:excisionase family DNA binding protein
MPRIDRVGEYLTVPQVAETLGISQERVRKLIKWGRLPALQFDRTYILHEDDVEERRNRRIRETQAELARLQARSNGDSSDGRA